MNLKDMVVGQTQVLGKQKVDLSALEKLVKKMPLKDGKVTKTEIDDGLGGDVLEFTVEWKLGKHKWARKYYVGDKRETYFDFEFGGNSINIGADPKKAVDQMKKKLTNPYRILEEGKYKGKPWYVVERTDTHPPFQGIMPGKGATDITIHNNDRLREQIKLQMK